MAIETRALAAAMHALVDDYRTQCLWFLRLDDYPTTREEQLRVLDYVQRDGDREAHIRAANLRQRLPDSSA